MADTLKFVEGYEALGTAEARAAPSQKMETETEVDRAAEVDALETRNLSFAYLKNRRLTQAFATEDYKLQDVNVKFGKGARVLIAGANGAGKSTLLSIVGGKKMIPRQSCLVRGKEAFHDPSLNSEVMYCGDWWRTDFFFNITVRELIGEEALQTERCRRLVEVLQVDLRWRINAVSDGQRRRCQLLESLWRERMVYVMDEITTDLDLVTREHLLAFLKQDCEERGCTILYATHIFDTLAEWATHFMFFAKGKVTRCCTMAELEEYQALRTAGERCPLYKLVSQWVFEAYPPPPAPKALQDDVRMDDAAAAARPPVIDVRSLSYSYVQGTAPQVKEVGFTIEAGSRVLVVGANGACKSTVLSVLAGKRMIPRGYCNVLGQDAFNDTGLAKEVAYCGDWWRTNFFMNLQFKELLPKEVAETARVQHLAEVLQVNLDWYINEISDGQRRRCQLLECLSVPRQVYLMDEITSDLDLFARESLLAFLKQESEERKATILYCTHIFDHLEGWGSHMLHLSRGAVVRCGRLDEIEEYQKLLAQSTNSPLYTLVQKWVYDDHNSQPPPTVDEQNGDSPDGRIPNLGLAGPTMMRSG